MNRNEIYCTECEYHLNLGAHPHLGQKIRCPRCETGWVVTNLKPIELDLNVATSQPVKRKNKPPLVEVLCPECDQAVKLRMNVHSGYRLRCNGCQTTLEVVNTNPLELDPARSETLKLKQQKSAEAQKG